jgi:hypothetical protein
MGYYEPNCTGNHTSIHITPHTNFANTALETEQPIHLDNH